MGNVRLTIGLMIGLPGAGKSTLCDSIVASNKIFNKVNIIRLCFDSFAIWIGFDKSSSVINEQKEDDVKYKQFRRSLLCVLESLVNHLVNGLPIELPDLLNIPDVWLSLNTQLSAVTCENVCILVDDNMYYRSMRYSVFQIARKYQVGYCQIHVDSPVDECIRRNRARGSNCVLEDIIIRMSKRLEPPAPTEHLWEHPSLSLNAVDEESVNLTIKMILDCMERKPFASSGVSDAYRDECRQFSAESILHQCDLILRQLVKQEILRCKTEGCSSGDLKKEAALVNIAKQRTIAELRDTELWTALHPICESKLDSRCVENALHPSVTSLFMKHLVLLRDATTTTSS